MRDKSDFHRIAIGIAEVNAPEAIDVAASIADLVLEKNKRYGNSALEPIKIFSKHEAGNSICDRLDDKLSRVKNSSALRKNDVADLMGYLLLLCKSKEWIDFSDLID